jgi:hypothetical protein
VKQTGHSSRLPKGGTSLVLAGLLAIPVWSVSSRALADGESSTPAAAGPGESSTHVYLSAGVGGSAIGPMALANLSVERGHFLFQARAGRTEDLQLFAPPRAAITDYSGLLGAVVRRGSGRVYVAAGLGLGCTSRRGKRIPTGDAFVWFDSYEPSRNDNILNVPLQLGMSFDGHYHGIGLDFVANVNREVSTYGVALTYRGGWIR